MGPYGVTCNAFAPEANTRFVSDWATEALNLGLVPKQLLKEGSTEPHESESVPTYVTQDSTVTQLGDPLYFAPFIAYLASDAAANINDCIFYLEVGKLGIQTSATNQTAHIRQVLRRQNDRGVAPQREADIAARPRQIANTS